MTVLSKWTCGCLEITLPQGMAIVPCTHHHVRINELLKASPKWSKGGSYHEAMDDPNPQDNSRTVIA